MKKIGLALAAMSCFMFANNAFAIDTTELLDKGVIEVAPTIGLINLQKGSKPGWESDLYVGYGVMDFMTISSSFSMATGEAFADVEAGFDFDILFTPLDTENFDIDFHVDFGWSGGYTMTPGLELNFDSDNEMSGFGAFLNIDFPMYSAHVAKNEEDWEHSDDNRGDVVKTDFTFALSLGLYYTFMEGNQLLLQGGLDIPTMAEKLGKRRTDGFVALGYNVEVMENFEIVSEVRVDIPDRDTHEDVSAALTVGAIIDLPMM